MSGPDWYDSSPIARRPYCAACGSSLGFQYKEGPNLDLTVAAFDDPARFRPIHHFGAESMHRGWINIKSAVTGKDEHAILAECERGEDSAVAEYRKALDAGDLPAHVAETLRAQSGVVKAAHDRVRNLRDALVIK